LAGPSFSLATDLHKATVGNIQDQGKNAGRDLVSFMRRWTPAGSNWYWRAAYEREILDQLQMAIDPNYQKSFKSKASYAKRMGSDYFYQPGGDLSLPDFGNAVGQ